MPHRSGRSCRDVEYMVDDVIPSPAMWSTRKIGRTGHFVASTMRAGGDAYFKSGQEALSFAALRAMGGTPSRLSVLVHSERGARCYGGDDAVRAYREDPEASVFEQFTVRVDSHGRVS